MKGYAPRLALKKRYKTTRKWPIFFAAVEDKVIVTFECVDEILNCDHSNESY